MTPEAFRSRRNDIVWAAVYVSAIATTGLALLFGFGGGTRLDTIVAIDLVVGWMLAATTAVFLLTAPGEGPALLVAGRALIWLAFATLVLGAGLGILSIAGLG